MADYWSNFCYQHKSASLKRPRWGWSPANIQINFTSSKTRMIVLPDTENHTVVSSFVYTQYRNVTDRRTDGQNPSGYYSALYCQQCRRAIKIRDFPEFLKLLKFAFSIWDCRLIILTNTIETLEVFYVRTKRTGFGFGCYAITRINRHSTINSM